MGHYPFLDPDAVGATFVIIPDPMLRDSNYYLLKQAARSWVLPSVIDREKFSSTASSSPYVVQQAPDSVRDYASSETLRRHASSILSVLLSSSRGYATQEHCAYEPLRTDWLMLVLATTMLVEATGT